MKRIRLEEGIVSQPAAETDALLFKKILFVESNRQIMETVRDTLDLHFFDVTVAGDGPQAVKLLMSSNFDLILCDVTHPSFPCDMFFEAVRRTRPQLCKSFIAITDALHSAPPGTIRVWKPIDMHILLGAIESVLKKKFKAAEEQVPELAAA